MLTKRASPTAEPANATNNPEGYKMSIYNILTVGNDAGTLADKATELTKEEILTHKIQTLIENMMDTCHDADGLGLAANQVGATGSICVYKIPGKPGFQTIINPVIVSKKGKFTSRGEGCLSLPGRYFSVKRYKKIVVTGLDRHGNPIEIETKSKQLAKILQHEIDHLNGITIADKGKKA